MMSEKKIKEAERIKDYALDRYSEEVFVREEHPEEAIMIWVTNWQGLITQISGKKSKRVWIRVDSKDDKFAIGHVYLRTNKGF